MFTPRAHARALTSPHAEALFVAVIKGKACSAAVVPYVAAAARHGKKRKLRVETKKKRKLRVAEIEL